MGVIVGLDVGTTAAKAVAVDTASGWRTSANAEYRLDAPRPRWQVQDPSAVLAAVDTVLAEVARAVGDRGGGAGSSRSAGGASRARPTGATGELEVLGVGTAMHGLIGMDAELRPVTELITWADTRAHAEAAELRAQGRATELLERSGTPVHPMSPLTKLMWFGRHDRSTLHAARHWIGLKDLVLLHLTGRVVTELSTASASGLVDLAARDWSPGSLDLAGVSREQLPDILPTTALLELSSAAADRTGLPSGLPVNSGATDGPLGNLGTGAIAPGVAGMSIGTSGAVRTVVPEPRTDSRGRLFCYALTDDAWVLGGAVSNGGLVMRWAAETFLPQADGTARDAEALALAAQAPPGSDGLVMLPYLLGERAPLWDPDLSGSYLGVRHAHGREHFMRAALEGVCLQMADLVDVLDGVTPVTEVRCTGGVFRSGLWRGVMAAALGRPLVPTDDAEGSALGSVALALLATGRADDLTGALAQVAPAGGADEAVEVPEADRATYARVRGRTLDLLRGYGELAEHLADLADARG
ncbi:gluconokinase [Georgenia sp. Z1491]|uniref:gluconokinase n=1 Tax=Georgenia sp. Z1491 TaxID=3416707 RepID=UPI003CEF50D5